MEQWVVEELSKYKKRCDAAQDFALDQWLTQEGVVVEHSQGYCSMGDPTVDFY